MRRIGIPLLFVAWSVAAMQAPTAQAGTGHGLAVPGGVEARSPGTQDASSGVSVVETVDSVEEILGRYNDGIHRALAGIESLRVAQTIFEPQDDGSTKRACAVLSYGREHGLAREETFSELVYPAGEYALSSLIGPELDPSVYSVEYVGADEQEGVPCHRLEVTAITRDCRHFDGSIWISTESFAPVRIVGAVVDPPFPAKEIRLDKVFTEGPHGLWLVRRHRGHGEFRVLFISKQGERTIYYDDYEVEFAEPALGSSIE